MSDGADEGDAADRAAGWQRLDRWLWCARFFKTRAAAARPAEAGRIRINRQATGKAHAKLRPGDVLTFPLAGDVRVIRVASLAHRRGPAPEARLLYEDLDPPVRRDPADRQDGAALAEP